jgi:hypothetical protein
LLPGLISPTRKGCSPTRPPRGGGFSITTRASPGRAVRTNRRSSHHSPVHDCRCGSSRLTPIAGRLTAGSHSRHLTTVRVGKRQVATLPPQIRELPSLARRELAAARGVVSFARPQVVTFARFAAGCIPGLRFVTPSCSGCHRPLAFRGRPFPRLGACGHRPLGHEQRRHRSPHRRGDRVRRVDRGDAGPRGLRLPGPGITGRSRARTRGR